jgi:hypothetical protein
MNEERPVQDPMARATRTMGIITAVLTGLVAFNTLVYSCANDRKAREEAAIGRLESEEKFWNDATKELSELIRQRGTGLVPVANLDQQCRLLAFRTIGRTQPGDLTLEEDEEIFKEFNRAADVNNRVQNLRKIFVDSIQNPKIVDSSCVDSFNDAQIKAQDDIVETQEIISRTPNYKMSSSVDDSIRQRLPSIALTPVSSNGWDIDVFWCARRDPAAQSANFERALNEGLALAAMAQRGDRIGNERLGRIRVRTLSESAQNVTGPFVYFKTGNRLLFDKGNKAEEELAAELTRLLNQAGPNGTRGNLANGEIKTQDQQRPSKWYLSLFICEAGLPSPAPTQ